MVKLNQGLKNYIKIDKRHEITIKVKRYFLSLKGQVFYFSYTKTELALYQVFINQTSLLQGLTLNNQKIVESVLQLHVL